MISDDILSLEKMKIINKIDFYEYISELFDETDPIIVINNILQISS